MLQQMRDLDRDVVGQRRKRVVQLLDEPPGMRRTVEEIRITEADVLSALRDLTDVRDTVRAYLLLMERGRTGEAYNIARGESHAMQAVLDALLAQARVRVTVQRDPTLVRAAESVAVVTDATRLRRETGWAPAYPLDRTLSDILDYWRSLE